MANIDNLMSRKIGLVANSYDYMIEQLSRNIGNSDHFYDGYGTPIGHLANPYYNSIVTPPWFILDKNKNEYSNYIEYIKGVYGATLSVQNINKISDLNILSRESIVPSVPTSVILDTSGINAVKFASLNLNGLPSDTKLGVDSWYHVSSTLRNAAAVNSNRNLIGVTAMLSDYYGLKYESIDNSLLTRSLTDITDNLVTPLDVHGIGYKEDVYNDFIESLGEANKEAYFNNTGYNKRYIDDTIQANISDSLNRFEINVNDFRPDYYGGFNAVYGEESALKADGSTQNDGVKFGRYSAIPVSNAKTLLNITNIGFMDKKYKTLIGRFYTGKDDNDPDDTTQTAKSKYYGLSHGRNLLKVDAVSKYQNGEVKGTVTDDYTSPYCRVWTYHHQYKSLLDTIRPFTEDGNKISQEDLYSQFGYNLFSAKGRGGFSNGRKRLDEHGVLNKNNGLVNISPIDNGVEDEKVKIKNCMFSIENLAWKDVLTGVSSYNVEALSPEQKGPFGGRIMWFPPYGLTFNEDVNVEWSETGFIGRGENIYTYKNTKRTGTLSFKLLIDHPSVVNYFTNAKRDQDSGDVDDVESAEQEMLRFFAGCSLLTAKVKNKNPEKPNETAIKDSAAKSPTTETYTFFVFFPNNYSGNDDDSDYAMDYLINGYGTMKALKYPNKGYSKDNVIDFNPPSELVAANYGNEQVGGYEMRSAKSVNYGIDTYDITKKNVGDVKYGNLPRENIVVQKDDGQNFQYYYRVDDKYLKTPLKFEKNYLDSANPSSCLNSSLGFEKVKEQFKLEDEYSFSFADLYVAYKKGSSKEVLSGLYDDNKISLIQNKIQNRKGKIKSITCIGAASAPGNDNYNLAMHRARTVRDWLTNIEMCNNSKIHYLADKTTGGDDDVNSLESKLYRHVRVDIEIRNEETNAIQNEVKEEARVVDNQVADNTINVNGDMDVNGKHYFQDYSETPGYNNNQYSVLDNRNNYPTELNMNKRDGENGYQSVWEQYASERQYNPSILRKNKSDNIDSYKMHDTEVEYDTEAMMEAQGGYTPVVTDNGTNMENARRYDEESQFFDLLKLHNPFLHNKITEKVKYFDPAFHSISPEGFNARLTFLQQCCRQGPTNGASDSTAASSIANNLAFGRPPVCILRIGDFYYTRIIIEGVSINYDNDGLHWDLNQEGIGVMPMIADVNIRFNFIGGSSLAGPISRLQNALSFNMYANTEVYDDRAEVAEYNENGEITKLAPFNPSV